MHDHEHNNVVACPVHGFITLSRSVDEAEDLPGEAGETSVIDTPFLQRLRRIHQLQAAWWVFPSGEHTRLQHCFGTMHLAGTFAKELYPSLKTACHETPFPSQPLVVETMRLAGLLHDVGHGPFGHFFDEQYLKPRFGYTHEDVSAQIIRSALKDVLSRIRRSPDGPFNQGERIDPDHIAYLIKKGDDAQVPQ